MRSALLYVHGFMSSPESVKGRMLKAACEKRGVRFFAPDLNCPPQEALERLKSIVQEEKAGTLALVGSSLGGFYATSLADAYDLRVCLVNPATHPWDVVKDYVGEVLEAPNQKKVTIVPRYADDLRAMAVTTIKNPEKMLVLLSTADEVLNWTEAKAKYAACRQLILPGETHRVEAFGEYVDTIFEFLMR